MPSYPFRTQVYIVVACMVIHNFLRRFSLHDELFEKYEDENVVIQDGPSIDNDTAQPPHNYNKIFEFESQQNMIALRDQIAN